MKKGPFKMAGMAALAGQKMMRSPNYTPPTQTDQGPMMGGALSPSQLSEAQKAQQEALRTQMMGSLNPGMQAYNEQMRAYKRNEFLGQQKGMARKGYRKMEMPVKPSGGSIGRPNPYAPGVIGGGPRIPRRFSGGVSQLGNMQAQLAPFMMKKGSKPSKSEFFKGKK